MRDDMIEKINMILYKETTISEDETRSLMILISKIIELMSEVDKQKYLTLNLFCNWCKHTKIDKSITGLRTIARVNDTLVKVKNSKNITEIESSLSEAIGYASLRKELILLLNNINLDSNYLKNDNTWVYIFIHIIEIIRDVPLEFPSINNLDKTQQTIYNKIVQNPVKPGAGIIMISIKQMDYSNLGIPNGTKTFVLHLKSEDTTNLICPLLIDTSLV